MLLAAFEPGKEMAIANFSLAIFCLFTFALPLLLITRGDKTEANRDFITAAVNPWSNLGKKVDLTPVVITGISSNMERKPELEVTEDNNPEPILNSEVVNFLTENNSTEIQESLNKDLATNDEAFAA